MIFPITIGGSLNQILSDRFSNREIEGALTELIPDLHVYPNGVLVFIMHKIFTLCELLY